MFELSNRYLTILVESGFLHSAGTQKPEIAENNTEGGQVQRFLWRVDSCIIIAQAPRSLRSLRIIIMLKVGRLNDFFLES